MNINKTISFLAKKLNFYHKKNFSNKFWRIVLLPYVNAISYVVLDRYKGSKKKSVIRNHRKVELEYEEMTLKEAWKCKKLENIRFLHTNNRRCEIKPGCQNCRHGMKKKGVTYVPEDWNVDTMKWENHTWRNG